MALVTLFSQESETNHLEGSLSSDHSSTPDQLSNEHPPSSTPLLSVRRQRIQLVSKRTLMGVQYLTHCLTLLSLVAYLSTSLCKYHWTVTLRPLLARHRWDDDEQKALAQTYYDRDCNRRDFSTSNLTELIVQPEWDSTKAAENILTHGVSVFPGVIDRESAHDFRNFTLERNAAMSKDDLVYVMNTYTKKKQTRWAFAFTAHDHPSVPRVLKQVVGNDKLRDTLELFLGPDPAMIKMQTITAAYKAEHQGWHPDVNALASVKSHARNFMMHFSLFIALQDTTAKMGSTGVCPGSQYCTTVEDTDIGCGQVVSGSDSTGTPVWLAGDAVLMNQNTWHRGWEHTLRNGPDRAIIVITFTSRPRISDGRIPNNPMSTPLPQIRRTSKSRERSGYDNDSDADKIVETGEAAELTVNTMVSSLDAHNFPIQSWKDEMKLNQPETRSLSLGTPLTSFGHTMEDMRDPSTRFSTFLTTLRFLSIYKPPSANWGWTYVASLFSRISTETHKFKKENLSQWLGRQHRKEEKYMLLQHPVQFLLHRIRRWYIRRVVVGAVPAPIPGMGIWDVWYVLSFEKAVSHFQTILIAMLGVHMLVCLCLYWTTSPLHPKDMNVKGDMNNPYVGQTPRCFSQGLSIFFRRAVAIVAFFAVVNFMFQSSALVRDIQSGQRIRTPFPLIHANFSNGKTDVVSLIPLAGIRRVTHGREAMESTTPSRNDVLVGTRFDSLYLRIMNRFLDYHTGNKSWRLLVREFAGFTQDGGYYSLPWSFQTALAESIVRRVQGRFLAQIPESGTFATMSMEESVKYTRRALLLETSSLLSILDQTVSFVISQLRFESRLRTTSLSRICVGYMEEIREKMFREDYIQESENITLRPLRNNYKSSRSSSFLPSQYFPLSKLPMRKHTDRIDNPRIDNPRMKPEHIVAFKKEVKSIYKVLDTGAGLSNKPRARKTKATADGKRLLELHKKRRNPSSGRLRK